MYTHFLCVKTPWRGSTSGFYDNMGGFGGAGLIKLIAFMSSKRSVIHVNSLVDCGVKKALNENSKHVETRLQITTTSSKRLTAPRPLDPERVRRPDAKLHSWMSQSTAQQCTGTGTAPAAA